MPVLDKNRIEGFGNDSPEHVWSCPSGHLLLRGTAAPSKCDRCYRSIQEGEAVMDCRRCDWYICRDCHPPSSWDEETDDGSFWGAVSHLVDTAAREVSKGKSEVQAFVYELRDRLQDVQFRLSCQPPSLEHMAIEDAEVLPLQPRSVWSEDEEDLCVVEGTVEPRRAFPSKGVLLGSVSLDPVPCEKSKREAAAKPEEELNAEPSREQPALAREPTDLIEWGCTEESFGVALPAPIVAKPAGCAAPKQKQQQKAPVDLLSLPGCLPEESLLDLQSYDVRQPPMMLASMGA